jgi:hypothetical protein
MDLRTSVESIYAENTEYSNATTLTNFSGALSSLSKDLYTDPSRFVYELLQNADDSAIITRKQEVSIKLFDDFLVFAHMGKPFNMRDLEGLCNINHGTKKEDQTKTGYKGIGFKSVFGQSDLVIIYSEENIFRFDSCADFKWNAAWGESKETWEEEKGREFLFPWQTAPIWTTEDFLRQDIFEFIRKGGFSVATVVKLWHKDSVRKSLISLLERPEMFIFL